MICEIEKVPALSRQTDDNQVKKMKKSYFRNLFLYIPHGNILVNTPPNNVTFLILGTFRLKMALFFFFFFFTKIRSF